MQARYAEAEEASRMAIVIDGKFSPAWVNLGRALHELGRFPEARDACLRASKLTPQSSEAWVGLANALIRTKQFVEVVDAYQKAVALQPTNADFHANLAVALRRIGEMEQAVLTARRALELDPTNTYATWNLANWLLADGFLAEGWLLYESRWARTGAPPRRYPSKGAFPASGRVLLWAEQGVGDEILYGGMAREIAALGAAVTLEVDPRLAPLFQRSFAGVVVRARQPTPDIDAEQYEHVVPLGSLPQWLRSSWQRFPAHPGYLFTDERRLAAYRERLQHESPGSLIVGIAWRSSNPELAVEKSAPLIEWRPLLQTPGVAFVNLQYGSVEDECRVVEQQLGVRVHRVPDLDVHDDLDGLAALQGACDLVITISNINAHISGSLGRTGWVLLPKKVGRLWYWFHGETHSLWYPSLTLIPQLSDGDWASAIQAAADRLRAMLAERR
jgi:tetratricopeptide (TPR) repeat protein